MSRRVVLAWCAVFLAVAAATWALCRWAEAGIAELGDW